MTKTYESQVIDDRITYWKFSASATAESFMSAFEEFNEVVHRPGITRLMVVMGMEEPAGRQILDLWLETGRIADGAGIEKWGVVVPAEQAIKRMAIEHMVRGGDQRDRRYQVFFADNESEVLQWCRT